MKKVIKLPIFTNRLLVDDFTYDDAKELYIIANNINNNHSAGYMPFWAFQLNGTNDIKSKVDTFIKRANDEKTVIPRKTYRLAVRLKTDKRLIGNVTVDVEPSIEDGKTLYGDLGYFLNPDFGGKGYASEAAEGLLKEYFNIQERLDITAHPNNLYSKKLITKLGGHKIGELVSGFSVGEPRDWFAITKQEFLKSREK